MIELNRCKSLRWPNTEVANQIAIIENPANKAATRKRAFGHASRFWLPGRTLKISFQAGLAQTHAEAILQAGREWLEHANLIFEHTCTFAEGDIRIVLDPAGGNSSLLGTDALLAEGEPTMWLSVTPDHRDFRHTVLHEFGHALGADHEHQHPQASIQWDTQAVYDAYIDDSFSREEVDLNVLGSVPAAGSIVTPYDPHSIMHYSVPGYLTRNGFEVGTNRTLSALDMEFMRQAYPPARED